MPEDKSSAYVIGQIGTQPIVLLSLSSLWQDNKSGKAISTSSLGGGDMEARIARLESDVNAIQTSIADIKLDIREFRKESREDFASVREEFEKSRTKADADFRLVFKCMFALVIGIASIIGKVFGLI
jgi:hypothetical protein